MSFEIEITELKESVRGVIKLCVESRRNSESIMRKMEMNSCIRIGFELIDAINEEDYKLAWNKRNELIEASGYSLPVIHNSTN